MLKSHRPLSTFGILLGLLLALSLPASAFCADDEEVWLMVDTHALEVRAMRGKSPMLIFKEISIGRFGATSDKRRLDGKTPLGEFRINLIKNKSAFHRFFGIDYPQLDQAERALELGSLSADEFRAIRQAIRAHRPPPQNTALGGHLGIHGLGAGDLDVHEEYNWTQGCIALTNEQIDELTPWLKLGTRVVIY